MKYPFLTLPADGGSCSETEITFSDIDSSKPEGDFLRVCVERWNGEHDDFDDLVATLSEKAQGKSGISVDENRGFSAGEADYYMSLMEHAKGLFFDFARDGGICHA